MLASRLRLPERAPGSVLVGGGEASGFELRFHKRGADGSGKCDLVATGSTEQAVWGAVWVVAESELLSLDRSEGVGYRRVWVEVEVRGDRVGATTYMAVAGTIDPSLVAFDWYRAIVVAGAREVGLPEAWVERLEAQPARPDPDCERSDRFLALLP